MAKNQQCNERSCLFIILDAWTKKTERSITPWESPWNNDGSVIGESIYRTCTVVENKYYLLSFFLRCKHEFYIKSSSYIYLSIIFIVYLSLLMLCLYMIIIFFCIIHYRDHFSLSLSRFTISFFFLSLFFVYTLLSFACLSFFFFCSQTKPYTYINRDMRRHLLKMLARRLEKERSSSTCKNG
jgi:hypothetical protein